MHQIIHRVGSALPAFLYANNGYIKVATTAGREAWRSLLAQGQPAEEIDRIIYDAKSQGLYWEPFCPLPSKWGEVRA